MRTQGFTFRLRNMPSVFNDWIKAASNQQVSIDPASGDLNVGSNTIFGNGGADFNGAVNASAVTTNPAVTQVPLPPTESPKSV